MISMEKQLTAFYRQLFTDLLEALVNIEIFLPYFFSVSALANTLFSPWKNLVAYKTTRGFSFSEWFNRFMFDMISRGIGFILRSCIIFAFLFIQVVYLILIPLILIFVAMISPLLYLVNLSKKSPEELKQHYKEQFILSHMTDKNNYQQLEEWFEQYYNRYFVGREWWKLTNLRANPPLARDWTAGYTPYLDDYAIDLTDPSNHTMDHHILNRKKEVNEIERLLSKTEEANIVLVGEEAVGKHAIIEALAQRIYAGKTNALLMYKRVLRLDMEKILTKYTDIEQRQEFLENLLAEAALAGNVILSIDNFERYVSIGEQHIDLTTAIEKYAKNQIQFIGITTPFFYQKFITPNTKIMRLFSKVDIQEMDKEQAKQILFDSFEQFEIRYKVTIPYETLVQTIEKSDYYITSMPFPEKALQLLDNACVYTVQILKKNIVYPSIIDTILTERTHVPTILTDDMRQKLLKLESLLQSKIISQREAISQLASALRRSFLLLGKRKKPLASFLFLGPTGVGKTETAKAIANVFFGSDNTMLRFDMSAYQNKTALPELIGSIETGNPGLLTKEVREHPYGVLLLDEIEKADRDLLNIFLTVLDEGYFTDGYGHRVDCKNLIIIATSNAGAAYIFEKLQKNPQVIPPQSLNNNGEIPNDYQNKFQQELLRYLVEKGIFAPEFLNRFDGIVAYQPLTDNNATLIARKFLQQVTEEIFSLYKVKVRISDHTLNEITQKGYDPAFGARDMERILRHDIEDRLAKMILEGKAKEGDVIQL